MTKKIIHSVCPFCHRVHERTNRHLNIICDCGGKYYASNGDWINRKTGETVRAPKEKCGCKKCKQWQINRDECGWSCISFEFTVRMLKNILECDEYSLTEIQKEAIKMTIETVEEQDKSIHELLEDK